MTCSLDTALCSVVYDPECLTDIDRFRRESTPRPCGVDPVTVPIGHSQPLRNSRRLADTGPDNHPDSRHLIPSFRLL